jgi:hypothetical protein
MTPMLPPPGPRGLRLEIGEFGETQRLRGAAAEAVSRLKRKARLYQRLAQIIEDQRVRLNLPRADSESFT